MAAVKAGDVERALRSRRPDVAVLLFYGPDQGRVSALAREAAAAAVDYPADPFQLVRLDGDHVADRPESLVEEASTIGLFGGRRAVWVRAGRKSLALALKPCLELTHTSATIVIEAGDLARTAPLRGLCEQSPRALALPCYPDEGRSLGALVDSHLSNAGLKLDRTARDLLLSALGGDRLTTLSELDKLVTYCAGALTIAAADVEAVVSNVSASRLDACIDEAFSGSTAGVEAGLRHLEQQGMSAVVIVSAALRHAIMLASRLAEERDPAAVVNGWRGLHFQRKPAIERQVAIWSQREPERAAALLQGATLKTRRYPDLSRAICSEALLRIAREAARSGSLETTT